MIRGLPWAWVSRGASDLCLNKKLFMPCLVLVISLINQAIGGATVLFVFLFWTPWPFFSGYVLPDCKLWTGDRRQGLAKH